MIRTILIHYDEIGIKGNNRPMFENALMKNLEEKVHAKKLSGVVKKLYGRIEIRIDEMKDEEEWIKLVQTTFGISNFSFAYKVPINIDAVEEVLLEILKDKDFETFRMSAKRGTRLSDLDSMQVNMELGGRILEKMDKKVKLENADVECHVETLNKDAFVYLEKLPGPGGLPVGVSGTAGIMLSGGIDSPVAAWYMMKRGLRPVYIHFHSAPYTNDLSMDKVKQLKSELDDYSPGAKLFMVPFGDIQKQIMLQVPDKLRIIMYRRYMIRLTEAIGKREKIKVIVTGEALGQVASQTLENLTVVESVATLPILRPLIGFDKREIIDKSKIIGTYDTSILPHEDCCTVFMPKSPETRAKLDEVESVESKLDLDDLLKETIEKTEVI
jgi:tRNA uracil 4-sulfurtransferase